MTFSRMVFLFLAPVFLAAEPSSPPDSRPPFDKSAQLGTVWTHVNDWKDIPFAQDSMDVDYALQRSQGDPVHDFALMARQLERFGIDGIYLQAARDGFSLRNYLRGFRMAGNGRKVAYFMAHGGFHRDARRIRGMETGEAKVDAVAAIWADWLNRNRKWFVEHPNYHRVDGHPVIVLYGFGGIPMTPELWAQVVPKIESQAYRCIWLYHDHFWREGTLQAWLPHMDGVTQYAAGHHYRYVERIAEAMKEDWPQKIFEANAGPKHQSVLQGGTGYDKGRLTAKWREALAFAFDLQPDSMHLTNWNDIEENSHIFPSYLQRDSYLRIFDAMSRDWRGEEPLRTERPSGIFSSKIDAVVGEKLDFEWVYFGLEGGLDPSIEIDLQLTNAAGEVLHAFEPRTVRADRLGVLRFEVPSLPFAREHGVFPELRLRWNGETLGPWKLRGTRLWYGAKPTDLPWMMPLDEWQSDLAVDWGLRTAGETAETMARPGAVVPADPNRPYTVERGLSRAEKGAPTEAWLLLNGEPEERLLPRNEYFRNDRTAVPYRHRDPAPFSWLEVEVQAFDFTTIPFGDGSWTSRQPNGVWAGRPIYLAAGGQWRDLVSVPVPVQAIDSAAERKAVKGSNYLRNIPYPEMVTLEVPRYRIPFWDYAIDEDWGGLFRDRSGYEHHGWLGTHAGNRHTPDGPFGFRFSHQFDKAKWPVEAQGALNDEAPRFERDADGEGYLRFDGDNDYVFLPPGSRMPFGGTYELRIRAEATGQPQTLLASLPAPFFDGLGKTQVFVLRLDAEGRPELVVHAGSPAEQTLRADEPLAEGEWVDLAVTYGVSRDKPARYGSRGKPARYDGKVGTGFTPGSDASVSEKESESRDEPARYETGIWQLWVDGEPVGAGLTAEPRGEWQAFTHMYVGADAAPVNARQLGSPKARSDFFAGDLAELRITGRPLEAEELREAAER